MCIIFAGGAGSAAGSSEFLCRVIFEPVVCSLMTGRMGGGEENKSEGREGVEGEEGE